MSKFFEEDHIPTQFEDPIESIRRDLINFYRDILIKKYRKKKKRVEITTTDPITGDDIRKIVTVGDPTLSLREKIEVSKVLS